jgi:Kef-type K+ transport system membrane component KefB
MNPKLTYFSSAMIVSVIILILALVFSSSLHNPQPFWLSTLGAIFLLNVTSYLLGRRNEKNK